MKDLIKKVMLIFRSCESTHKTYDECQALIESLLNDFLQAEYTRRDKEIDLGFSEAYEAGKTEERERLRNEVEQAKREVYEEGKNEGLKLNQLVNKIDKNIADANELLDNEIRKEAYLDAAKILYDKAMLLPGGNARTAFEWGAEKLREKAEKSEAGE